MSGATLIEMRKNAVRGISVAEDKAHYIEQNADTLFSLDLTMYSGNATLNSLFYNAIASSKLDSNRKSILYQITHGQVFLYK